MANHYYYNGKLFGQQIVTQTGNTVTVNPGESVVGDPSGEFARQAALGALVDNGTSPLAGSTIVFTETSSWGPTSGFSGYSGANPGASGYSGATGTSGYSGKSGYSGAGLSGYSGLSGFSGAVSGPYVTSIKGLSGIVGVSGAGCTPSVSGQILWISVP